MKHSLGCVEVRAFKGGLAVDALDGSDDEDIRARKKAIARSSKLIAMAFFSTQTTRVYIS